MGGAALGNPWGGAPVGGVGWLSSRASSWVVCTLVRVVVLEERCYFALSGISETPGVERAREALGDPIAGEGVLPARSLRDQLERPRPGRHGRRDGSHLPWRRGRMGGAGGYRHRRPGCCVLLAMPSRYDMEGPPPCLACPGSPRGKPQEPQGDRQQRGPKTMGECSGLWEWGWGWVCVGGSVFSEVPLVTRPPGSVGGNLSSGRRLPGDWELLELRVDVAPVSPYPN